MTDNLNERLKQSMAGQPQTNIDERQQYLGSLRERIFLRLTVDEAQNKNDIDLFLKHFADYKDYQILINGQIAQTSLISQVIASCAKNDSQFIVVNDETASSQPNATGILVVAKDAINESQIDLKQKYQAPQINKESASDSSESLFGKLFKK